MKVTEYKIDGSIAERNIPSIFDLSYYYGIGRRGRSGVRKIQYIEKGRIQEIFFNEQKDNQGIWKGT